VVTDAIRDLVENWMLTMEEPLVFLSEHLSAPTLSKSPFELGCRIAFVEWGLHSHTYLSLDAEWSHQGLLSWLGGHQKTRPIPIKIPVELQKVNFSHFLYLA
jgi:hypothetical protein